MTMIETPCADIKDTTNKGTITPKGDNVITHHSKSHSTDNTISTTNETKDGENKKRNIDNISNNEPAKSKKNLNSNNTNTNTTNTTTNNRDERDERRMEINRIRAKEIRKRKKEMEEDMQKQIIQLTLENNKLRTQLKMQQTEISVLRNNSRQQHHSLPLANPHHQYGHVPQDYREQLLRNPGAMNLLVATLNQPQNMMMENPGLSALNGGFGSLPSIHPTNQHQQHVFPNIAPSSSLSASARNSGGGGSNGLMSHQHQHQANRHHDMNNFFDASGTTLNAQPQMSVQDMGLGVTRDKHDVNQEHIAKLLANSSSNVKHSLLEKLTSEEEILSKKMDMPTNNV